MRSNSTSYSLPVVLAVGLHLAVAALFLFEWQPPAPPKVIPKHIMANVIAVENQADKQRKDKARQRQEQKQKAADALSKQRQKEKKAQDARKAADKKKKAAEEAEHKRQLALKKKAEEKAEKERKAAVAEKARQQKEAEEERQRQEQEARELAELEQQMLEKLAQEEAAEELVRQQEAERRAKLAARIETEYLARIRDQISSAWVYPPGVAPDQEVEVELSVVPTGEVISIVILRGSGNQSLDRSVEQAIRAASPLPVPDDIRIFDASFRQFRMKFRPENATW